MPSHLELSISNAAGALKSPPPPANTGAQQQFQLSSNSNINNNNNNNYNQVQQQQCLQFRNQSQGKREGLKETAESTGDREKEPFDHQILASIKDERKEEREMKEEEEEGEKEEGKEFLANFVTSSSVEEVEAVRGSNAEETAQFQIKEEEEEEEEEQRRVQFFGKEEGEEEERKEKEEEGEGKLGGKVDKSADFLFFPATSQMEEFDEEQNKEKTIKEEEELGPVVKVEEEEERREIKEGTNNDDATVSHVTAPPPPSPPPPPPHTLCPTNATDAEMTKTKERSQKICPLSASTDNAIVGETEFDSDEEDEDGGEEQLGAALGSASSSNQGPEKLAMLKRLTQGHLEMPQNYLEHLNSTLAEASRELEAALRPTTALKGEVIGCNTTPAPKNESKGHNTVCNHSSSGKNEPNGLFGPFESSSPDQETQLDSKNSNTSGELVPEKELIDRISASPFLPESSSPDDDFNLEEIHVEPLIEVGLCETSATSSLGGCCFTNSSQDVLKSSCTDPVHKTICQS